MYCCVVSPARCLVHGARWCVHTTLASEHCVVCVYASISIHAHAGEWYCTMNTIHSSSKIEQRAPNESIRLQCPGSIAILGSILISIGVVQLSYRLNTNRYSSESTAEVWMLMSIRQNSLLRCEYIVFVRIHCYPAVLPTPRYAPAAADIAPRSAPPAVLPPPHKPTFKTLFPARPAGGPRGGLEIAAFPQYRVRAY